MVKAVLQVETSGDPFIKPGTISPRGQDLSGLPKVQFEGHVFFAQLRAYSRPELDPLKVLNDPATASLVDATGKPIGELLDSILYRDVTMKYVMLPPYEWDQLVAARAIHEEAANKSASWGAFQIMGFNHKYAGCDTVGELMKKSAGTRGQLECFVDFCKSDRRLVAALKAKDFRAFARAYNGPGRVDKYETELKAAYKAALV
jgi:hypothetical protein